MTEVFSICGVLHDLVRFVQFKKREKHPWKSVTFSKGAEKISALVSMDLLYGRVKYRVQSQIRHQKNFSEFQCFLDYFE